MCRSVESNTINMYTNMYGWSWGPPCLKAFFWSDIYDYQGNWVEKIPFVRNICFMSSNLILCIFGTGPVTSHLSWFCMNTELCKVENWLVSLLQRWVCNPVYLYWRNHGQLKYISEFVANREVVQIITCDGKDWVLSRTVPRSDQGWTQQIRWNLCLSPLWWTNKTMGIYPGCYNGAVLRSCFQFAFPTCSEPYAGLSSLSLIFQFSRFKF